jgi:translation initiation factor IF-1
VNQDSDIITLTAVVTELLPSATFRVKLDESGKFIIAHASGKIRKNRIRIAVGDKVEIEVSPYGLDKGRLVKRL